MPMPLSSDKLHLTMTKSSTFSGLRDALLAVTTFPAAENTLSDFELAAGTGKTILTRCERSVKYTLQLSWFTLPKTRPEPDPEPGLLTITRPEPDPKSKSATRQALKLRWWDLRFLFYNCQNIVNLLPKHCPHTVNILAIYWQYIAFSIFFRDNRIIYLPPALAYHPCLEVHFNHLYVNM